MNTPFKLEYDCYNKANSKQRDETGETAGICCAPPSWGRWRTAWSSDFLGVRPVASGPSTEPEGQPRSVRNLQGASFLQGNTLGTPDLPEREAATARPPHGVAGTQEGTVWPLRGRRQTAAGWLPHDTNYTRENKGLRSRKQAPRSGAETALHEPR